MTRYRVSSIHSCTFFRSRSVPSVMRPAKAPGVYAQPCVGSVVHARRYASGVFTASGQAFFDSNQTAKRRSLESASSTQDQERLSEEPRGDLFSRIRCTQTAPKFEGA